MSVEKLKAYIWRRGRSIITWEFTYVSSSDKSWWSTPGWYRASGRGRVYRLTIDHDYPAKPIWLGYKSSRKWTNAEGLYEVLLVTHPSFALTGRGFRGASHRSLSRRGSTEVFLEAATATIIDNAAIGIVNF